MPLLANAQMTVAAAPGTGAVTLGAATAGAQTWAAGGAVDGASYSYRIEDAGKWEIGVGVYTATGTKLTRSTVLASSNSNAAETFSAAAVVSQVALPTDIQAPLGFSPVQQGGGPGQEAGHKINIGWSGATGKFLGAVDGNTVGALWSDVNAPNSLATNGYQKLPSGLIVQWGSNYDNQTNDPTVTFPVAFPNAVVEVTPAPASNLGSTGAVSYFVDSVALANFVCRRRVIYNGGTVGYAYAGFYWFAIGY